MFRRSDRVGNSRNERSLDEGGFLRAYLGRRLLALIPTLFFASLIVFVSMRLIPGDVIDLMLAQNDIVTGQDRAKIEAALGLDQPVYIQ